jgi:hypothetical protein
MNGLNAVEVSLLRHPARVVGRISNYSERWVG